MLYHRGMLRDFFLELEESEVPHVLFLAFCHTDKNELTDYMREVGVIALAGMKNERGEITKGRLFKLDREQAAVIERAADYHEQVDSQVRVVAMRVKRFDI